MSKSRRKNVNVLDEICGPQEAEAAVAVVEVTPQEVRGVGVEVPVGELCEGAYVSRHVDVQLTHRQARALKAVTHALDARGEILHNGRRITTQADTVRWLCEQIAG